MRAAQKLHAAELARLEKPLDIQILVGVKRRLHHHVFFAGAFDGAADGLNALHGGRHRHGAGAVLARVEDAHRLFRVIRNGGDEVDRVDRLVGQHLVKAR